MHIMVVSDLLGALDKLEKLLKRSREFTFDALCFCGNVVPGLARWEEWERAESNKTIPNRNQVAILQEALEDLRVYKKFCALVDSLGVPVLLIPGHLDAPEERYFLFMQQASFVSDNIVLLQENIAKVGPYIFTGFGGKISEQAKEDYFLLQYPRSECRFGTRRMHFLNPPRILLFHSPPVSRLDLAQGVHHGSRFVNDVIAAVSPSFLFCGHVPEAFGVETIGSTVVVNPGALADGRFAMVNTNDRSATLLTL